MDLGDRAEQESEPRTEPSTRVSHGLLATRQAKVPRSQRASLVGRCCCSGVGLVTLLPVKCQSARGVPSFTGK